jgi:hypothetical protein
VTKSRGSTSIEQRAAAAFAEPEPDDLGPAQRRALRYVGDSSYYEALALLRREAWEDYLRRVPASRRRTALNALRDVLTEEESERLGRLVPGGRRTRTRAASGRRNRAAAAPRRGRGGR